VSDDPPWEGADDPRVQAGMEHLQRAAREVIAASRALLDVAEELVDDPRSASGLADLLGGFASRMGRPVDVAGRERDDADDDGEPPVQRIPVS